MICLAIRISVRGHRLGSLPALPRMRSFQVKGFMRLLVIKEIAGKGRAVGAAIILSLLLFNYSPAHAQTQDEGPVSGPEAGQDASGQRDRRRNLMRRLNLTPDQIERIRVIREENKEEWLAARQRLRQAQRALDEAIYTDNADEAIIEERAREAATAQAALVRMRALTELKIRRVLTREQLITLRNLRQQRAANRNGRLHDGDQEPRRGLRRGGP
jgi:Spy/CpxP family protein refolding chaperone